MKTLLALATISLFLSQSIYSQERLYAVNMVNKKTITETTLSNETSLDKVVSVMVFLFIHIYCI